MKEPTNNPGQDAEARRDVDDQPAVEWAADGTSLIVSRPADFDDAQWRRMMDQMREWWAGYSAAIVENTRAPKAGA